MKQEEADAAFSRIFGGLHPTPLEAFRAGVEVGESGDGLQCPAEMSTTVGKTSTPDTKSAGMSTSVGTAASDVRGLTE